MLLIKTSFLRIEDIKQKQDSRFNSLMRNKYILVKINSAALTLASVSKMVL